MYVPIHQHYVPYTTYSVCIKYVSIVSRTNYTRLANKDALDFLKILIHDPDDQRVFQDKKERSDYFETNLTDYEILQMVNASDGSLAYWTNIDSLILTPEFACDVFVGWKSGFPSRISLAVERDSPYRRSELIWVK